MGFTHIDQINNPSVVDACMDVFLAWQAIQEEWTTRDKEKTLRILADAVLYYLEEINSEKTIYNSVKLAKKILKKQLKGTIIDLNQEETNNPDGLFWASVWLKFYKEMMEKTHLFQLAQVWWPKITSHPMIQYLLDQNEKEHFFKEIYNETENFYKISYQDNFHEQDFYRGYNQSLKSIRYILGVNEDGTMRSILSINETRSRIPSEEAQVEHKFGVSGCHHIDEISDQGMLRFACFSVYMGWQELEELQEILPENRIERLRILTDSVINLSSGMSQLNMRIGETEGVVLAKELLIKQMHGELIKSSLLDSELLDSMFWATVAIEAFREIIYQVEAKNTLNLFNPDNQETISWGKIRYNNMINYIFDEEIAGFFIKTVYFMYKDTIDDKLKELPLNSKLEKLYSKSLEYIRGTLRIFSDGSSKGLAHSGFLSPPRPLPEKSTPNEVLLLKQKEKFLKQIKEAKEYDLMFASDEKKDELQRTIRLYTQKVAEIDKKIEDLRSE